MFRAQFGEGRRIDDPATLSAILTVFGVDAATALDAAQSDDNKARLRAQTEEAQRLGIFGAPTFITPDGELFWGNDRLERRWRWARSAALRIEPHRQAGLGHVGLASRTVCSPKWKIEAASTAVAWPSRMPSTR